MERGNTPTPPLAAAGASPPSSPPPNCAICLGKFKNKSYTETCLHEFCFNCLLRWSKIKAECPLCKQPFKSIIHNIRSNDCYDKYIVEQQEPANDFTSEIELFSRRFRYRTTLTLRPVDNLAIQRLLFGYHNYQANYRNRTPLYNANRTSISNNLFRRTVYRQNLWVCPLPDITGRYRECSPEFFRNNPAQITRLVPWLNRELSVFIFNRNHIDFTVTRITEALPYHPIRSRQFREIVSRLFFIYIDHFIHEFYSFASSPYDIVGYDRNVTYQNGNPSDNYVNEIFSSEHDSSDSEICFVPTSEAGPSSSTSVPSYLVPPSPRPSRQRNLNSISNPVMLESISHSESEDSNDDVEMVGYIKPPEQRTPEIVDLLGSDSDDIIIEEPQPSVSNQPNESNLQAANLTPILPHTPPNLPSTSGLVKLSVKRSTSPTISLSDSDDSQPKSYARFKSSKAKMPKLSKRECRDSSTDSGRDSDSSSSTSSKSSLVSRSSGGSWERFDSRLWKNDCVDEEHQTNDVNGGNNSNSNDALNQQSHSSILQLSVPHSVKKKYKKYKHKKHSKKNLYVKKKHKHKSKSKKKHKSKDKSSDKSSSKGKYCKYSKSKIRSQKE